MDYLNAFWVGGLICALVQILLDRTKLMPGRVMVLLVCLGAVLGAFGIYQPIVDYGGAGASASWIWKSLVEGCEEGGRQPGASGNFRGRTYVKRRGNQRGTYFRISGFSGL